MRTVEVIGFIAFALNVAGNIMLTSKNARGWFVRVASNLAQAIYAGAIVSPSLLVNAGTFTAINVYGWIKWKRLQGHLDYCGVGIGKPCNCGRLA